MAEDDDDDDVSTPSLEAAAKGFIIMAAELVATGRRVSETARGVLLVSAVGGVGIVLSFVFQSQDRMVFMWICVVSPQSIEPITSERVNLFINCDLFEPIKKRHVERSSTQYNHAKRAQYSRP